MRTTADASTTSGGDVRERPGKPELPLDVRRRAGSADRDGALPAVDRPDRTQHMSARGQPLLHQRAGEAGEPVGIRGGDDDLAALLVHAAILTRRLGAWNVRPCG